MVDEVDAEEKAAEEAAYTAPKGPATEMAEKQREQQTSFSKAREAMYGEGLAGVGAKKKVFDKIVRQQHFWWSGIREDIRKFLKTCHGCQQVKRNTNLL